jgi:tetratricopeptide (TPR) repeat protein
MEELRGRAENWSDRRERSLAYQELSRYERLLGKDVQALADAERAIEFDPAGVMGFVRRAEAKRAVNGESAVQEECKLAAAIDLATPAALHERGTIMRDFCRRPDLALADYARAIELAPHWADPYSDRAFLLLGEDLPEESLSDLDKAIELQPKWADLHYRRGNLNASLERFERALSDYGRCLALGQRGVELYANRGYALLRLGRDSEGLSAADAAIALRPQFDYGYVIRARFLFWLGRVYETATMLQKAAEVNPTSFRPHQDLATYAIHIGEPCEPAKESLDKAEELAGESASAWAGLAWLYASGLYGRCPELYDQEHALELAQGASRLDPQSGEVLRARAFVLYRAGRYGEALESIERAIEEGFRMDRLDELYLRDEPATLFVAAMAAWQIDRKQPARSYLERAVTRTEETFPRSPELTALRAEASRLLGQSP